MVDKKNEDESRAKFLEALEKKKKSSVAGPNAGPNAGSKVGEASGGAAAKRFQRKSGSA